MITPPNPGEPLRTTAPRIDDIARIEKKDAVVRSYPPPPVLPETAARLNRFYLGATLFIAVVVSLLLPSAHSALPAWDQQADIRSVYVLVKNPVPALLQKLEQMSDDGVDVRLISTHSGRLHNIKIGVVTPDRIPRECVIINGSQVYSLPPGGM